MVGRCLNGLVTFGSRENSNVTVVASGTKFTPLLFLLLTMFAATLVWQWIAIPGFDARSIIGPSEADRRVCIYQRGQTTKDTLATLPFVKNASGTGSTFSGSTFCLKVTGGTMVPLALAYTIGEFT